MAKKNYKEMAEKILKLAGGKENIISVTHCLTRLRFNVRDKSLINKEELEKISGVLGLQWSGEQLQVIIGQDVGNVYEEFCILANVQGKEMINENLDGNLIKTKEKLTLKGIVNKVIDAVGACISPIQNVIIFAGIIKIITAALGPSVLNIFPESSDVMRILNIAGDTGFYFLPVFVAYAGSKKFGCNTPLALLIAGILLSPSLIEIINAGESFSVYGIPMTLTSYGNSFLPMVLITWVMAYIEKQLVKIIPNSLKSLLLPLSLMLIMLPLALCVLGPVGTWLGEIIATVIVELHKVAGPLTIAIIAALWSLLVATGMHHALIAIAVSYISSIGYDDSILIGAIICFYAMMAIDLAYLIKAKNAEDRVTASSSLVTLAFGGISEPSIFGILLKNKRALINIMIGGFVGGFYAGLMNVYIYFPATGNIFGALGYAGKAGSFTNGVIASALAFVVAFGISMITGFDDNKKISFKRK